MNDIARQSGGEAFVGMNDIAGALQRAMAEGSNYYTLAYQPSNHDWNGAFRKIHVDLEPRGYSLAYRRGFIAYPDKPVAVNIEKLLKASLQPEEPESTMLVLRGQLRPPDGKHSTVGLDLSVEADQMNLVVGADGRRRGQLLVMLVAQKAGDKEQIRPPNSSGALNVNLDAEQYKQIVAEGVRFHEEVALSPGKYRLRLGVADAENGRIGTLDMPVDVPAAAIR